MIYLVIYWLIDWLINWCLGGDSDSRDLIRQYKPSYKDFTPSNSYRDRDSSYKDSIFSKNSFNSSNQSYRDSYRESSVPKVRESFMSSRIGRWVINAKNNFNKLGFYWIYFYKFKGIVEIIIRVVRFTMVPSMKEISMFFSLKTDYFQLWFLHISDIRIYAARTT